MYNDQPLGATSSSSCSDTPRQALLVDDIAYTVELLGGWLRPLGFEATYASNIAEAKKALAHVAFDVVFLDCELPDGFGYDLAAEIREMPLEPAPALIGMTASDENAIMVRCFSAGVDAFMHKPLTFDLVCEHLQKCELLDPAKTYKEPARSRLSFSAIHFMSRGDSSRFLAYLKRIDAELDAEVAALLSACRRGEVDAARAIIHRLLSLTPLVESRPFTTVLQSCQRVARMQDRSLLQMLGQAAEWEYRLVKTSLQDELARVQPAQSLSLRKSA